MPTSDSREQTPTSSPTKRKFLARLTNPAFEITNLTVEFGEGDKKPKAVESLNLSIPPGESFGLVGECGSGKSTVLQAICGLGKPKNGTLRLIEKHSLTTEILHSVKVYRWSFKTLMDHSIQNTLLIVHSLSL